MKRLMPKVLAKVHPTYKTPYVAALFVGILSIILVAILSNSASTPLAAWSTSVR